MKASEGKHNHLVNLVVQELETRGYDIVNSYFKYQDGQVCGEIDVYAIKDKYALLFEIKCSNNYKTHKKAVQQLHKDEHLFRKYRPFKFMVYWDNNKPHYEWVRK